MNGELHHLMLLASIANMNLINNRNEELEQYKDKTRYIVRFINEQKNKKSLFSLFSSSLTEFDSANWMIDLKARKCNRIFIINFAKDKDESVTSAFIGGGRRWGLICQFEDHQELWIANWELESKPPNTRWEITYRLVDSKIEINLEKHQFDLFELMNRLKSALYNISQLAIEIQMESWKENFFDKGIHILDGDIHAENQLTNIYSVDAQRLINAVSNSWVFGGMGSWNDSPPYYAHQFGKESEFNTFTNTLYDTMMDCIEGSINSVASQR